jgi:hypothetical protein
MCVSLSFNEIESLAFKAARGAGLAWGMAEEAAAATRWLAAAGVPWATALLGVLDRPRSAGIGIIRRPSGELADRFGAPVCPLTVGTHISDQGPSVIPETGLLIKDVAHPRLLLPFVARLVTIQNNLVVELGSERVMLSAGAPAISMMGTERPLEAHCATSVALHVSRAATPSKSDALTNVLAHPVPIWVAGTHIEAGLLTRLQAYESRTYVPASDQSRIAGAGAGLSDND